MDGHRGTGDREALFDRALIAAARELLNRARVLAEAPAAAVGRIGSSVPASREPSGSSFSVLDLIGGQLRRVHDDRGLAGWLEWAKKVIEDTTHTRHVALESVAQRNRRICSDYVGEPAPSVAYRERLSVTLVRKIRDEGYVDDRLHRRRFHPRDGQPFAQDGFAVE